LVLGLILERKKHLKVSGLLMIVDRAKVDVEVVRVAEMLVTFLLSQESTIQRLIKG